MKKCFKCEEEKPLSDFYPHPQMADGHLNKCKACAKQDVKNRVAAMPDGGKEYERQRNQKPKRRQARRRYSAEHIARYPQKRRARVLVGNALRSGKLVKGPCETTGCMNPTEAHHDDYSKPLDVRWMCLQHHRQYHQERF